MLILGTNIISELIKPKPSASVLSWFEHLPAQPMAMTAITAAKLSYGIAALPDGKRKSDLSIALDASLAEFGDLILAFDSRAAHYYGVLMAQLRKNGTPIGQFDVMIAAIVMAENGTLVTRNTRDFHPCGIDLIDPFAFG